MKKIYISSYHVVLLAISTLFWIYLIGLEYANPINLKWLNSGDLSTYQLGWQYFREDTWRFPIGLNPNYGINSDSNIVYSDSIPLFAIIFKIFNFFLPNNFQYFSIWILLCLYLQVFFAYKIIFSETKNNLFSIVGSLFFLFASILIHRSGIHLSLLAHWLILSGIYIEISNHKKKNLFRLINLVLSVSIHFYFTLMLIILIFFQDLYKFLILKKSLIKIVKNFSLLIISTIFFMYILGYFSIGLDDGLGWGYGYYNFNLNSFFNPSGFNNNLNISWSNYLNNLEYQNGELEGFAYLGLSGIVFLILFGFNLIKGKYVIFFKNLNWIFIFIPFLIISISNNVNLGVLNLFYVDLNKYIYAFLSIFRASGRLIWPIFYFVFIVGIIFIFKYFKSRSILILLLLFFIQLTDLQNGLKNYKFGTQYFNLSKIKQNKFWNNLSVQFEEIKLIESKNQSKIYNILSAYLIEENFLRTDLINLARINREKTTFAKYKLINEFKDKNINIFNNSLFLSDNYNYVSYIKYLFEEDVFFYFVDDIWVLTNKKIKNLKSDNSEFIKIPKIDSKKTTIELNKNFLSPAIGWETSTNKKGFGTYGYYSAIILDLNNFKCKDKRKIKFNIKNYYLNNINLINFKISENDITSDFNNKDLDNVILEINCREKEIYNFIFEIENPLSEYDQKIGLNREKKSLILESISILE